MKRTSTPPSRGILGSTWDASASPLRSGLTLLGGVVLILAVFVGGEWLTRFLTYREHGNPSPMVDSARHLIENAVYAFPKPLDDGQLETTGLPVYELRVRTRDWDDLKRTAEQVCAAGMSTGIDRREYDAQFLDGEDWVDVTVKLRGLTSLHYRRERPSLRIKFPRNRYHQGIRSINISDPYDKGLTRDVVTNLELARHGIMTWDNRFVVLRINGSVIGLFQEIEQFGRSMIDRAGRTEGYLFSATGQGFTPEEGPAWERAREARDWLVGIGKDPYREEGETRLCTWERMQDLLDIEMFAQATALTTLLASQHAWWDDNIRVYYDPARGKLEPIPWDYNCYPIFQDAGHDGEVLKPHSRALLDVPEFRRLRDRHLWTLLEERVEPMIATADSIFRALQEPLDYDDRVPPIRELLDYDRFALTDWDEEIHAFYTGTLRENARFLRELYQPAALRLTRSTRPQWIRVENHGKTHVVIEELVFGTAGQGETVRLSTARVVDGRWFGEPGSAWLHREAGWPATGLTAVVATHGASGRLLEPSEVTVERQPSAAPEPPAIAGSPEPTARPDLPEGARWEGAVAVFAPGTVRLSTSLVLPEGFDARFRPGLDLYLEAGCSLVIRGDLESRGTAGAPVRVHGDPGWGALVVQGTRTRPVRAHLEWTYVHGGVGAETDRVIFSGSFSATDATVIVEDCRFEESRAVDGLNLKYCEVTFRHNRVSDTADDAVDFDFCRGEAVGNRVLDSGGDGIDFSGCDMEVRDNWIARCLDKGLSIGERSRVRAENNLIQDCRTGLAVKDESRAVIRNCGIARVKVGVSLYRKKMTFGNPSAQFSGLAMSQVTTAVQQGRGATLNLLDSVRFVEEELPLSPDDGLRVLLAGTPRDLRELLSVDPSARRPWGLNRVERVPGDAGEPLR